MEFSNKEVVKGFKKAKQTFFKDFQPLIHINHYKRTKQSSIELKKKLLIHKILQNDTLKRKLQVN